MKSATRFCVLSFFLLPLMISAQNAGIGTDTPSEKLEVSGIIYTNEGGVRFPDETLQTTAAFNSDPEDAAMVRGVGVISFSPFPGPLDTLQLQNVSMIYDLEFLGTASFNLGGSGGPSGTGPPMFESVALLKDIDITGVSLFSYLVQGDDIEEVDIYLIREDQNGNPELYYRLALQNVYISQFAVKMVHLGKGEYAHVEAIGLSPVQIAVFDLINGTSHCWNLATGANCN